jgi:glycosyltransferase involved in cell wall biosynthesis
MKILITAPSLDENENVSGISAIVRQIVKRSGHEFFHFQAGRRDGERSGLGWFLKQALLVPRFNNAIKKFRPDVVHINTSLVKRAIARDVLLAGAARKLGKPVVLHVHGGPFAAGEFEWWHVGKNLLNQADKVIVLSDREKEAILDRDGIRRELDIEVLPNAVPVDEVPDAPRERNAKSIVYFGRIDANKGLDLIVEACACLKEKGVEFRFNCYGTGPQGREFIDRMLGVLGDDFYYGGVVTGADKWRVLAENDVFLLPSRYEGLPMALLEAMAAGCVPVVSNVGSIATVVEDGVNGVFVNETDAAERLGELLSGRVDLAGMSLAARATIRERFDIGDYVERLNGIYKECAREIR